MYTNDNIIKLDSLFGSTRESQELLVYIITNKSEVSIKNVVKIIYYVVWQNWSPLKVLKQSPR